MRAPPAVPKTCAPSPPARGSTSARRSSCHCSRGDATHACNGHCAQTQVRGQPPPRSTATPLGQCSSAPRGPAMLLPSVHSSYPHLPPSAAQPSRSSCLTLAEEGLSCLQHTWEYGSFYPDYWRHTFPPVLCAMLAWCTALSTTAGSTGGSADGGGELQEWHSCLRTGASVSTQIPFAPAR